MPGECQWATLWAVQFVFLPLCTFHLPSRISGCNAYVSNSMFSFSAPRHDKQVVQTEGDDTRCLFFAVKKSRGVVNISWYSDELEKTPTTYRNKFPETEIAACQALMWGFVLACPVQLCCACPGPDSVTQLDSIRNGNGWEIRGGGGRDSEMLCRGLSKLCPKTVVRVAVQFSSSRWTRCSRCHFCHPDSTVSHVQALRSMELPLCLVFPWRWQDQASTCSLLRPGWVSKDKESKFPLPVSALG